MAHYAKACWLPEYVSRALVLAPARVLGPSCYVMMRVMVTPTHLWLFAWFRVLCGKAFQSSTIAVATEATEDRSQGVCGAQEHKQAGYSSRGNSSRCRTGCWSG